MTVLFLVWAAELDQYVFQDSQFEGLSKDIFSKLGSSWFSLHFFPVPWGAPQYPMATLQWVVTFLPDMGRVEVHLGCPFDWARSCLWFFFKVEHIGLEEIISESLEVLEEAGQKSQKRRE